MKDVWLMRRVRRGLNGEMGCSRKFYGTRTPFRSRVSCRHLITANSNLRILRCRVYTIPRLIATQRLQTRTRRLTTDQIVSYLRMRPAKCTNASCYDHETSYPRISTLTRFATPRIVRQLFPFCKRSFMLRSLTRQAAAPYASLPCRHFQ